MKIELHRAISLPIANHSKEINERLFHVHTRRLFSPATSHVRHTIHANDWISQVSSELHWKFQHRLNCTANSQRWVKFIFLDFDRLKMLLLWADRAHGKNEFHRHYRPTSRYQRRSINSQQAKWTNSSIINIPIPQTQSSQRQYLELLLRKFSRITE